MKERSDHDYIMPAKLYGMYEMELNPVTLSFPESLEKSFMDDFYKKSLALVRFSLVVGILFYSVFGILDAYLVPELKWQLWFIRFAVVCPFLLGIILFSYSKSFRQFFQISVTLAMIVAGFGIVFMVFLIPPPANYSYYAGLILVLIWGYTFTRVRFIWATIAGWLIVIFYEFVAVYLIDTPTYVLLGNNFFFITANLAGMLSSYSIEYYARRDFFLSYKLENERQIVEAANRRLEAIVQDRTAEIMKVNLNLVQEIEEKTRAEKKRDELENMLIQAQKMEALGRLGGGVAHDFNNLLMGIRGNTSLLLMEVGNDHFISEHLVSIDQYVQKGSELTAQLLAFARGGKYEVKTTDLNEFIKKSASLFGRTRKEITIHFDLTDTSCAADVDQGQMEQVLLNLFVNAGQAMPTGGNLYIKTEKVTIDADLAQRQGVRPGSYLKTSVRDTGVGIDEAIINKIFDPFFTTKEMARGTGLGLASVYGIIRNHEGFIVVESQKGNGTTFTFWLPISDKEIIKEKTFSEEILKGEETILLVDDEEMIIEVTYRMLMKLGYKVLIARSGEEAIDIYRTHKNEISLVILDMIMPTMGGAETFTAIKEINSNARILLSSGYSMSDRITKTLEHGCDGFIQKPFDIKQLSVKIRESLS